MADAPHDSIVGQHFTASPPISDVEAGSAPPPPHFRPLQEHPQQVQLFPSMSPYDLLQQAAPPMRPSTASRPNAPYATLPRLPMVGAPLRFMAPTTHAPSTYPFQHAAPAPLMQFQPVGSGTHQLPTSTTPGPRSSATAPFGSAPALYGLPPAQRSIPAAQAAPQGRTAAISAPLPAPPSRSLAPVASTSTEATTTAAVVEAAEDTDADALNLSNVPSMLVSNTFLDKNSQSHASALTAFGDIIDNARESEATRVSIEVRTHRGRPLIIISDNGCGMSEAKVREGLMSIGYTSKDLSTGKHYGFGGKTAIPRIADSALIFTREARTRFRTVGLLSTVFSESVGSNETKMPLCSWEEHGSELVSASDERYAPLTLQQREASVHFMLEAENCPYANPQELLQEFDRKWDRAEPGRGATGTRLVMWGIKKDVHVKKTAGDIVVDAKLGASAHERSLRAYASVLYLKVGTKVQPTLAISLRDAPVKPRDWQDYLVDLRTEYSLPKPGANEVAAQFKAESQGPAAQLCGRDAMAMMAMGYARPMEELVAILSGRGNSDESYDEKAEIVNEETGFFVYHKGRMTRALEKVKLQTRKTNAGGTSKIRITTLGEGLTGFIHETFLIQTHNKAAYLDGRLYDNLMIHANLKAKDFLLRLTTRRHGQVTGVIPKGLDELTQSSEITFNPKASSSKEKPIVLQEEVRMRPVNPKDPTVGRVIKALFSKGRYHLRRPDFTLSERTYLARDLVKTVFDPAVDVEPGMVAAPPSLAGCKVEVWWLPEPDTEDTGSFWTATLANPAVDWISPAIGEGRAGWFQLVYEDGFDEHFFVALKPGDATVYAAFRDDGEKLPGGIEFRVLDASSSILANVVEQMRRVQDGESMEESGLLASHSTVDTCGDVGADASISVVAAGDTVAMPLPGTIRCDVVLALCKGHHSRDRIVKNVRGGRTRDMTVTVLGKEKKQKVPLWMQSGSTYHLTDSGKAAARGSYIDINDDADMVEENEVEVAIDEELPSADEEVEVVEEGNVQVSGLETFDAQEIEVVMEGLAGSEEGAGLETLDCLPDHRPPEEEPGTHHGSLLEQDAMMPMAAAIPASTDANSCTQGDASISTFEPQPGDPACSDNSNLLAGMRVKAKYLASNPAVRPSARERSMGYGCGRWYEGIIREVHDDLTCSIDYDDGDFEAVVDPKFIVAITDEPEATKETSVTALNTTTATRVDSTRQGELAAVGGWGGQASFASHGRTQTHSSSRMERPHRSHRSQRSHRRPEANTESQLRDGLENDSDARISALEDEAAAAKAEAARLREQLSSAMHRAVRVHSLFVGSQMPDAAPTMQLPEELVTAIVALGHEAQQILDAQEGRVGVGQQNSLTAGAGVQSEEGSSPSEEAQPVLDPLRPDMATNGTADTTLTATTHKSTASAMTCPSTAGSSSDAPLTGKRATVDELQLGCRLQVWFTKTMLHGRGVEPHFEQGTVTWIGDSELARRGGGLTKRLRIKYDDGAEHEHLADEDHIELLTGLNTDPRRSVQSGDDKEVRKTRRGSYHVRSQADDVLTTTADAKDAPKEAGGGKRKESSRSERPSAKKLRSR